MVAIACKHCVVVAAVKFILCINFTAVREDSVVVADVRVLWWQLCVNIAFLMQLYVNTEMCVNTLRYECTTFLLGMQRCHFQNSRDAIPSYLSISLFV